MVSGAHWHSVRIMSSKWTPTFSTIEKLSRIPALIEEYDVVVGSRYIPGGSVEESWSIVREFLSRGGSIYSRLILGLRIHDPTGGFKMFSAPVPCASLT